MKKSSSNHNCSSIHERISPTPIHILVKKENLNYFKNNAGALNNLVLHYNKQDHNKPSFLDLRKNSVQVSKINDFSKNSDNQSNLFKKRNPSSNDINMNVKKEEPEEHQKHSENKKQVNSQSTAEATNNISINSTFKLNDQISIEREKLIQYIKNQYKKSKCIPATNYNYYKFIKTIGKGAFGEVSLNIHKLTGKQVAIKSIDKSCLKDDFSKNKVIREITILKYARHSNIIRLLEIFESQRHILFVMEYAGGGDLLHYLQSKKRINEIEAKGIFRQITYGLAHIHCRNIIHRDIKLDNILLDGEGGVKICDFGVSKIIDPEKIIYDQCGTPAYIAPEILNNNVIFN